MVPIVQLVRASDCGSECRGFESHWAPRKRKSAWLSLFLSSGVLFRLEMLAQCKIPVVLHPVHQSPRFHGQKSILLLFIHENTAFRGQKHHKACGTSTFGVARAAGYEELAFVFASSGALHNQSGFQLSSGNMPVFPDDPVQIVPFVREIRHFSGQACQFENFIRGKSDFPGHGCF